MERIKDRRNFVQRLRGWLKPKRKKMVDKTVEELRTEIVTLRERNKELQIQVGKYKALYRDANLKKKEWHAKYLKLRQKLEELK